MSNKYTKSREVKEKLDFYLTNLVLEIGKQVTRDYEIKGGIYEGMSISNVKVKDLYVEEILKQFNL